MVLSLALLGLLSLWEGQQQGQTGLNRHARTSLREPLTSTGGCCGVLERPLVQRMDRIALGSPAGCSPQGLLHLPHHLGRVNEEVNVG